MSMLHMSTLFLKNKQKNTYDHYARRNDSLTQVKERQGSVCSYFKTVQNINTSTCVYFSHKDS